MNLINGGRGHPSYVSAGVFVTVSFLIPVPPPSQPHSLTPFHLLLVLENSIISSDVEILDIYLVKLNLL